MPLCVDRFAGFSRLLRNHQSCSPIGSSTDVAPRGSDPVFLLRSLPFPFSTISFQRYAYTYRNTVGSSTIRPPRVLSLLEKQFGARFNPLLLSFPFPFFFISCSFLTDLLFYIVQTFVQPIRRSIGSRETG